MRWAALILLLAGCTEKPQMPLSAPLQKPAPLEPLVTKRRAIDASAEGEATYTVEPFTFAGPSPPSNLLRIEVTGFTLKVAGETSSVDRLKQRLAGQSGALLVFDSETYLAQTTALFAILDDLKIPLWLQSSQLVGLAWPVKLRDEPSFNAWLDEPVAGKLRIIQRSDGFELQTNLGKLAGEDPRGPTVPTRGGSLDLVTLQKGLQRVKQRFPDAPDVCFLPSYGTNLDQVIRSLATNWLSNDTLIYSATCLVYPRPVYDSGRR